MNTDTGYVLTRYSMSDHCPIHHEPAGNGIRAIINLNECEGGELQFFAKRKLIHCRRWYYISIIIHVSV